MKKSKQKNNAIIGELKRLSRRLGGRSRLGSKHMEHEVIRTGSSLDALKNALYKQSRSEGQLKSAGTIRDIAPGMEFAGAISLSKRLESGKLKPEDLETAKRCAEESYIPVSFGAAIRCGDGRGLVNYIDSDPEAFSSPQGVQTFGAAGSLATAYRLTVEGSREATLFEDIVTVGGFMKQMGIEPALHTDDHSHQVGLIGCGWVNGLYKQLGMYSDGREGFVRLANAIVGPEYVSDLHLGLAQEAPLLLANSKYADDKQRLYEQVAEEFPGACQVNEGSHMEIFVIVNLVPGTTLHREHFNARVKQETGKDIQVFSVDAWIFDPLAQKLFPDNPQKQKRFVVACADLNATPAALLTDGSLSVFARTPSSK